MHRSAALAVLALLLSGCSGNGSDDQTGPSIDEAAATTPGALAGPVGEPTGSIKTASYDGNWEVGWSAAEMDNTAFGTSWPQHTAKGDVMGVVIEMEWTPATPTADTLTLRVGHGDSWSEASGPSPLRLVLDGAAAEGDYTMAAVAGGDTGVYVHQAMTFHVAVFDGLPFDPAYSALAA